MGYAVYHNYATTLAEGEKQYEKFIGIESVVAVKNCGWLENKKTCLVSRAARKNKCSYESSKLSFSSFNFFF